MNRKNNNDPLVSIIVITYNSSNYIREALESATAQIYKHIELIISDDCSTDNTVEICRNWLKVNKRRFQRTALVTGNNNQGVSANCNQGLNIAEGDWIKYIAGDDILTKNSIFDFIETTKRNPKINFIFGAVVPFQNDIVYESISFPQEFIIASAKHQHNLLLKKDNCILGPASFIKRSVILSLGGFDTRIPMQEDYPLWVKATGFGHKLYFKNFICAKYRIHKESLTSSAFINKQISPVFQESYIKMQLLIREPFFLKNKLYLHYWHYKMHIRRNTRIYKGIRKIYRYGSYLIDPLGIYFMVLQFFKIHYKYHINYEKK